ncbi:MAG: FAD-dependent oxidoreductase [Amphritea sp.]|nr:FAD-dependent oxidoreductase [Amphritea sp.]
MRKKQDLVVIGGGPGGLVVASVAAQVGLRVTLIEKSDRLGGDCLHSGCVPSKTFIHMARTAHCARKGVREGLLSIMPDIDFGKAIDQVERVIDKIQQHQNEGLIQENDAVFKQHLDRYKYFERYPGHSQDYYRQQCEVTLGRLERQLQQSAFLTGEHCRLADIAIFPFIRQFAHVDRDWFYSASYPGLQRWLDYHLTSPLFLSVMKKYPRWEEGDAVISFPE